MILLIADDFTGALDTGIQFAKRGLKTKVVTASASNFKAVNDNISVLAIDAETRHLSVNEAYQKTFDIVMAARDAGISIIFKKTDSALRGNLGSELSAVLDASSQNVLHFLPAFPSMNRITRGGVHYIDGLPVDKSIFGHDNYNPIEHAYIPDLIATQSDVHVNIVSKNQDFSPPSKNTIIVYDASTDSQLEFYTKKLLQKEKPLLLAGCAGVANFLAQELSPASENTPINICAKRLLVFCGSTNKITQQQLDYAECHDFQRIRLTPKECLEGTKRLPEILTMCAQSKQCIIDTNDLPASSNISNELNSPGASSHSDSHSIASYAQTQQLSSEEVRARIVHNLSTIIKHVLSANLDGLPLITGGDTLFSFMNLIGINAIIPIQEVAPGVVLSSFRYEGKNTYVLSKSGGFGREELLIELSEKFISK